MPADFPEIGKGNSSKFPAEEPKKLPTVTLKSASAYSPEYSKDGLSGLIEPYRFDEFNFQPKLRQDNYKLRAQYQSTGEQILKTLGNTIANIPITILENVGYLGELFSGDYDYDNELISTMNSWKNPFGEVYRENPNEVFDLGDPAWWLQNFQSVAESAGAFAIQGMALGKLFSAAARGLTTAFRAGANATAAGQRTAQMLTAGTLAYTEGAMSGRQVFKQVYDEQYRKLSKVMDPAEADAKAREFAAKGAAATVRINTLVNTVFNRLELEAFFGRSTKKVDQWMKANPRIQGEGAAAYKARMAAAVSSDRALMKTLSRKPLAALGVGALAEGVEEVNTQYAEETGKEVGGIRKSSNLDLVSDYFDKITNQEGALNFILGAFGGVTQTAILENAPVHKVLKYDANGKAIEKPGSTEENRLYETMRVSSRTRDAMGRMRFFDNAKDAVAKDIEWFEEKRKAAEDAAARGDVLNARKINDQIFAVTQLRAVASGNADVWEGDYQKIRDLDNTKDLGEPLLSEIAQVEQALSQATDDTQRAALAQQLDGLQKKYQKVKGKTQAMMAGFAVDPSDNEYKKKATQAIDDLRWMTKLHADTMAKYAHEDVAHTEELAQYIFAREVDQRLIKRAIEEEERAIETEAPIHRALNDYATRYAVSSRVAKDLETDQEALRAMMMRIGAVQKTGTPEQRITAEKEMFRQIRKLLAKYKIEMPGEGGKPSQEEFDTAVNQLYGRLNARIVQHNKDAQTAFEQLKAGTDFEAWQQINPGKEFKDYHEYLINTGSLNSSDMLLRRVELAKTKEEWELGEQSLSDLKNKRGIDAFLKAAAKDKRSWKEREDLKNSRNREWVLRRKYGKEMAAQIKWQNKLREVTDLRMRIAKNNERITTLTDEVDELKKKLEEIPDRFNYLTKRSRLKTEIKNKLKAIETLNKSNESLKERLTELKKELEKLKAEYEQFKEMDVDDLINEPDAENEDTTEDFEETPPAPDTAVPPADVPPGDVPPAGDASVATETTAEETTTDTLTDAARSFAEKVALYPAQDQAIIESVRKDLLNRAQQEEVTGLEVALAIRALLPSWKNNIQNAELESALAALINEERSTNTEIAQGTQAMPDTEESTEEDMWQPEPPYIPGEPENITQPIELSLEPVVTVTEETSTIPSSVNNTPLAWFSAAVKMNDGSVLIAAGAVVHRQAPNNDVAWSISRTPSGQLVVDKVNQVNVVAMLKRRETYILPIFDEMNLPAAQHKYITILKPAVIRQRPDGNYELVEKGQVWYTDVQGQIPLFTEPTETSTDEKTQEETIVDIKSNEYLIAILPEKRTVSLRGRVMITDPKDKHGNTKTRYIPYHIIKEANKQDRLSGQTAKQINDRGGYSDKELDRYLPGWRDMLPHVIAANTTENTEPEPTDTKEPVVVGEPVEESSDPEITSLEELGTKTATQEIIAEHTNAQTESAAKVNRATIQYLQTMEGEVGKNPTTGEPVTFVRYGIVPLYELLDAMANHSTLIPGFVRLGDTLGFEIDTNYDGPINLDNTFTEGVPVLTRDRFGNHTTEEGKIIMNNDLQGYANMPVKIVHKRSGQVIGYLPRLDWVTAAFENAVNGRNIRNIIRDQEGNIIESNNIEKQAELVKEIRRAVAEAYNQGRGPAVYESTVSNVGAGYPFLNTEYDAELGTARTVVRPAFQSLPDTNLEFVISSAGVLRTSRTSMTTKTLTPDSERTRRNLAGYSNLLGVLLPMPNGEHHLSIMGVEKLEKFPADLSTMNWVLEAYLAYNTDAWTPAHEFVRNKIRQATSYMKGGLNTEDGLDITLEEDLEKFINQYITYSEAFGDHNTQATGGKSKFLFHIPRKGPREKALIKIGTSNSGTVPRYARLVNGKLDPEFIADLQAGLSTRSKVVNYTRDSIRGINDPRPFNVISFGNETDENGMPNVIENSYKNYNEYLKLFTNTVIYGNHKINPATGKKTTADDPKGVYVYGANPVINFDVEPILEAVPTASSASVEAAAELGIPTGPRQPTEEERRLGIIIEDSDVTSMMDDLFQDEPSLPLTLDNLRILHDELPADQRNGKTPKQVQAEMLSQLFTTIPPGMNPFKKC